MSTTSDTPFTAKGTGEQCVGGSQLEDAATSSSNAHFHPNSHQVHLISMGQVIPRLLVTQRLLPGRQAPQWNDVSKYSPLLAQYKYSVVCLDPVRSSDVSDGCGL